MACSAKIASSSAEQTLDERSSLLRASLAEGKHTDVVFIVGPEMEEVHALKGVLMMLSPFMESLFNGDWCNKSPIRLDYVGANVVKLVVEYTLVGTINRAITAIDLADLLIAADFFIMDSLMQECVKRLKACLTEASIWPVLNKVLQNENLTTRAINFSSVLIAKTKLCLAHPNFLTADVRSVIFLLKMERLALRSELRLVKSCIKWAKAQEGGLVRMRALLPHLRLLTLSATEVANLPDGFLLSVEQAAILKFILKKKKNVAIPPEICFNLKERTFTPNLDSLGKRPNKRKRIRICE